MKAGYNDNRRGPDGPREGKKNNGISLLGILLVVVGTLWFLKELHWLSDFFVWNNPIDQVVRVIQGIFNTAVASVGLPAVLLVAGIILLAGRRLIGTLLILMALLFFLPHLILPGIILVILFPVLLIIVGIIIILWLL